MFTRRIFPLAAALAVLAVAPAARAADDDLDALQEQAIKAAVKAVAPSVVQIETSGGTDVISIGGPGGGGPGRGPITPMIRKGVGPTSGLIVSPDGYIVSSAFNFANKPTSIIIAVAGHKERYVAKVVATDTTRMVTLLKIDPKDDKGQPVELPVPAAAPKDQFKIGQTSIAVGRTLAGNVELSPSVSVGIISAINRIWGRAIQTDAKVSPTNYGGPLVDLEGRVQGVLVPASPRAEDETAGLEWYDSGIGFAVPLEDINKTLPRLKQGKDLKRGVIGVNLQPGDEHSTPVVVVSVQPGSAAEKAGIKPGDKIVELDGKPVANQTQLRHLLGTKYEGDAVAVKVERDKEEVKLDNVVLGGLVSAYGQPFLGILPLRDDPEPGVEVRFVYPDSPAAKADLKAGDRIMKVGRSAPGGPRPAPLPGPGPGPRPGPGANPMVPVQGRDQLLALLEQTAPGTEIKLEVKRKEGGKTDTLTVKLAEAPEAVPEKLPEPASAKKALVKPKAAPGPAPGPGTVPPKEEKKEEAKKDDGKKDEKKDDKKIETGLIKRTTAAADHSYWIYVPENYDPNIAHALVLWLHPAGKNKDKDVDDLTWAWQPFCEDNHVILVGPNTDNAGGWTPSDTEFILEAVKAVTDAYTIDRKRVVAHGMGVGGQMAFYLGFHARNLIRGVAAVAAPLTTNPKEKVANQPLAFFLVAGGKDPLKDQIKDSKAKLVEHKYPVVHREIEEIGHQYIDGRAAIKTLEELARWIDSLDRM
jgi:S1-C subfamily serine protease